MNELSKKVNQKLCCYYGTSSKFGYEYNVDYHGDVNHLISNIKVRRKILGKYIKSSFSLIGTNTSGFNDKDVKDVLLQYIYGI
jgi:hypothetical protein